MRREHVDLHGMVMVAYGHYGKPFLVFPSEQGRAWDFENNGMIEAVQPLIEDGRAKLYCVDSADATTWSNKDVPLEERARRHGHYESWVIDHVVPTIYADSGGPLEIGALGCSLGAFHSVLFGLRRADLFPLVMGFSGSYDPSMWHGWGERGDAAYFANPVDFVPNLHGDHLTWLQSRLSTLLVVGQGQWEDTTGALDSTRHMAGLLQGKGLRCELDVWGHEFPHDWPSWRAQLAHHLPRFC
ncbi:alpha/beta hydrolase-fold protein [Actinocrispum sp. NPDC049592]|uniref:esterase family protein n=1 Tax=Actinocrispum sp. NPDC049592 TaxID=3154835 RepID=UPI003439BD18